MALALAALGPLYAGQAPVDVEIRPLFGQNRSGGGWVPFLVILENLTNQEVTVDIELASRANQSIARRRILLPRGSQPRSYLLYQYMDWNWGWSYVTVACDGRSMKLPRQLERVDWPQSCGLLIVGMTRSSNALRGLGGVALTMGRAGTRERDRWGRNQGTVVHLVGGGKGREPLPDHFIGWNCCDIVVLNDTPVDRLSEAEQSALVDWVHKGGELVLSPGADAKWFEQKFIRDLVHISEVKLDPARGDIVRGKKVACYELDIPGAVATRSQQGVPIAWRTRCGLGGLTVMTIDFSEPEIASWNGQQQIWTNLAASMDRNPRREVLPQSGDRYGSPRSHRGLTGLLSISKYPSLAMIVVLIVCYVILAGPVNFVTLRRRRWMVWLPIALGAIAAVYIGVIFIAGYVSKGVSSSIRKVAVVELIPGTGRAYQRTFFSIFSSAPRTYQIGHAGRSATFPFCTDESDVRGTRMICTYDGEPRLSDHHMTMWSTSYFASECFLDEVGEVHIERAGAKLTITNKTPWTLRDVEVIEDKGKSPVEDLAPGGTAEVVLGPQEKATAKSPWRNTGAVTDDEAFVFAAKSQARALASWAGRQGVLMATIEKDPMPPDVGTNWVRAKGEVIRLLVHLPKGGTP